MPSTMFISPEGDIQFIYDDALRSLLELGDAEVTRASHVEPSGAGRWTADMAPCAGPVLGPFDTRAQALATERAWLEERPEVWR